MARTNAAITAGFVPLDYSESDLVELVVADNYGTAIYPGEPVIAVNTGYVQRTPAGSAAGVATDGITAIVVNVLQYKDSAGVLRKSGTKYLPASTRWTAQKDRSLLQCVLATSNRRFKVIADTAQSSYANAQTANFTNADHAYGTADAALGKSGIYLDISTSATTATLQWRVLDWVKSAYNDPLAANYHAIVIPNLIYALPVQGHSTTGV